MLNAPQARFFSLNIAYSKRRNREKSVFADVQMSEGNLYLYAPEWLTA
jgi:hypothetical protein